MEERGHILVITINRPEVKNAFDKATAEALEMALDHLDSEQTLYAGIITGGGGTFCSGSDLHALARGERPFGKSRGAFGIFARPPKKPLIAAVEGLAAGGGFELCLACDLIVAARNARFGLPEVKHNLVAVGGGLFRLPKRIPYHLAMELALTGEMRDAEFFHRYGVVNRVVEPGTALDAALDFADAILANGPTALAATKEIISASADWTDEEAWERQIPIARKAFTSEDSNEGLRAFAEKRKPVWKGR